MRSPPKSTGGLKLEILRIAYIAETGGMGNAGIAATALGGIGNAGIAAAALGGIGNAGIAATALGGMGNAGIAATVLGGMGNAGIAATALGGMGNAGIAFAVQAETRISPMKATFRRSNVRVRMIDTFLAETPRHVALPN
jgi:hypothetical protein